MQPAPITPIPPSDLTLPPQLAAPGLTLHERVYRATILVRQYTATVAQHCLVLQRLGECPPEEKENLRWLLAALEQLSLPSHLPASVSPPFAPREPVQTSVLYHLRTTDELPAYALVFSLDEKLMLLEEVARRYPLLRTVVAPFSLYPGPHVVAPCCGEGDGFELTAAKIYPFLEAGEGIKLTLTNHNTILFTARSKSTKRITGVYAAPDYNVYNVSI